MEDDLKQNNERRPQNKMEDDLQKKLNNNLKKNKMLKLIFF